MLGLYLLQVFERLCLPDVPDRLVVCNFPNFQMKCLLVSSMCRPTSAVCLRVPAGHEVAHHGVVGSVFQFPDDVPSKMLFDFPVSRNWLAGARARILIPIVAATVADEDAPRLLQLADQINPFHAN